MAHKTRFGYSESRVKLETAARDDPTQLLVFGCVLGQDDLANHNQE
jgi:hypothetical protein